MDYNKIIIALVIIIVAFLMAGFLMFNPLKSDTRIDIVSDNSLFDGDNFVVKLSDAKGAPISNESVNIVITDANGNQNPQRVITGADGRGILQLNGLTPGNYVITVQYEGNAQYKGFNTSQNVEIKELKTVSSTTSSQSSSSSSSYDINNLPASNDPNPETKRYQIDENHVAQEYSDGYRSIVDLRTGERHGGFF